TPKIELILSADLPKGAVSLTLKGGLGRALRRLLRGKRRLEATDLGFEVIDERLELADRELGQVLAKLVALGFLFRFEVVGVHRCILAPIIVSLTPTSSPDLTRRSSKR